METDIRHQNNLELITACDRERKTFVRHQYTTYPLRLSAPFYLEGSNSDRAYHYLINTSPGLLAGDELNLALELKPDTSLYLTDQAATKVHPMPLASSKSMVNYQITIRRNASLELVPEPIILYTDSTLEQTTLIKLDATAKLFISEIILPGRLAKQEYYDFNYYFNRLKISNLAGELLFADASRLLGKNNPFRNNRMFATFPIIANAIAILPNTDIKALIERINRINLDRFDSIEAATTVLPSENGILIRVLGRKTRTIKQYIATILNCIRMQTNQLSLPYVPK